MSEEYTPWEPHHRRDIGILKVIHKEDLQTRRKWHWRFWAPIKTRRGRIWFGLYTETRAKNHGRYGKGWGHWALPDAKGLNAALSDYMNTIKDSKGVT